MTKFEEARNLLYSAVFGNDMYDCSCCNGLDGTGKCMGDCPKIQFDAAISLAQDCLSVCSDVVSEYETFTATIDPNTMTVAEISAKIDRIVSTAVRAHLCDYYAKLIQAEYE